MKQLRDAHAGAIIVGEILRPSHQNIIRFWNGGYNRNIHDAFQIFAAAYNINGQARRKVVRDVLELTDLTYKATAEVNGLSRGMQQRLSIARVLLLDPKVLLMDEPASGLDPRARIEIRELLKELKRMGRQGIKQ